jgi:hypothetical protein
VRKKLKLDLVSEVAAKGRVYRISNTRQVADESDPLKPVV